MKKIALIGSMRFPELFDRAIREFGQGAECWSPVSPPRDLVNTEKGHWHCAVDWADEVIVIRRPDGSIGAGTADELMHAVGTVKPIIWGSWC